LKDSGKEIAMWTRIAVALLVLLPVAAEKRVAMVLAVQGPVTIRGKDGAARPAQAMKMLSEKERVIVPGDGKMEIVFTEDNHRERVKPGSEVAIGSAGCVPAEAVERDEGVNVAIAFPTDVPPLTGLEPGAAFIPRGPRIPDESFGVSPMFGSAVLSNRPTLSWPAVADAAVYRVQMVRGRIDTSLSRERLVWTAQTKDPRLSYPPKAKALSCGQIYSWYVSIRSGARDKVVHKSQFAVPSQVDLDEVAKVRQLAASKASADRVMAALTYQSYALYDEALALFEGLAKEQPREAAFQHALAYYYTRAGRTEEGNKALERFRKLWPEPRSKQEGSQP
jgi:hypothetical protein